MHADQLVRIIPFNQLQEPAREPSSQHLQLGQLLSRLPPLGHFLVELCDAIDGSLVQTGEALRLGLPSFGPVGFQVTLYLAMPGAHLPPFSFGTTSICADQSCGIRLLLFRASCANSTHEGGPSLHQADALVEEAGAPVGGADGIRVGMSQSRLRYLVAHAHLGAPVLESRPEAVRRAGDAGIAHQLR